TSRRRHTRFSRDWSSDVYSSDLSRNRVMRLNMETWNPWSSASAAVVCSTMVAAGENQVHRGREPGQQALRHRNHSDTVHVHCHEIGRASCRERVSVTAGDGAPEG